MIAWVCTLASNVHITLSMRALQVLCVSCVCVAAGVAHAEGPEAPAASSTAASIHVPVALGSNLPLWWKHASSIAGSVSVGVADRVAIRANVATYRNHGQILPDTIDLLEGGDGVDYDGRITDLGIGCVLYSQSLWDGFMFEVGAFRRARDVSRNDEGAILARKTTVYAVRTLIGWSWRLGGFMFLATGIGLSIGRESGTETHEDWPVFMPMTKRIKEADVIGEAYLRLGVAFEL